MNIGHTLTRSARAFAHRPAITFGGKTVTYAQFNERANRVANALNRLGVAPGEHVVILTHNCPQMLETLYGCFKMGCAAVPLNFRLHPKEVAFIIDHSQATVVVVSPELGDSLVELRNQTPLARHFITLGKAESELLDYEELLAAEADEWDDADVAPDDTAWLFYTSGTTGAPKGAMLTHRNLLAMSMSFYSDICPAIGPDGAILHAAPLSHASGLWALPNIAKAANNVILESRSFDAEAFLALVQEHRITNTFCAPTMLKRLVECPAVGQYDHSSMQALCYGGGPTMTPDIIKAIETFGPVLAQTYGQGETPMTISCLRQSDHEMDGTERRIERLRSAGLPRTDVEVRIWDEHDEEVRVGELGEIVTRSDVVMKGYWRNPDATAESLRNGWLHTGDVGMMDDNGYVFLLDRSKDMIVSGGENIYPRDVEEVLARHPAVREVVVIGVPNAEWGEAVKAVVAITAGASVDESELIAFCREHLAGFKRPRSVDFVDDLPKNNYGKVLKRELRSRYWKLSERTI